MLAPSLGAGAPPPVAPQFISALFMPPPPRPIPNFVQYSDNGDIFGRPIKQLSQAAKYPSCIICRVCGKLMVEAAIMMCCGYSSCESCLKDRVIVEEKCPICEKEGNLSRVKPNMKLQEAIAWLVKLNQEGKLKTISLS